MVKRNRYLLLDAGNNTSSTEIDTRGNGHQESCANIIRRLRDNALGIAPEIAPGLIASMPLLDPGPGP